RRARWRTSICCCGRSRISTPRYIKTATAGSCSSTTAACTCCRAGYAASTTTGHRYAATIRTTIASSTGRPGPTTSSYISPTTTRSSSTAANASRTGTAASRKRRASDRRLDPLVRRQPQRDDVPQRAPRVVDRDIGIFARVTPVSAAQAEHLRLFVRTQVHAIDEGADVRRVVRRVAHGDNARQRRRGVL